MKISTIVLWVCLAYVVHCDLPVHCMASDIQGTWTLHKQGSLVTSQPSCGHDHPDKNTDHVYTSVKNALTSSHTTVLLEYPDLVYSPDHTLLGRWSMVYDEGFELFLDQNQVYEGVQENYFAFSKYSIKDSFTPKDDDDEKSEGYISNCQSTFLGWYRVSSTAGSNRWGCFYATKLQEDKDKIDNGSDDNTVALLQSTKSIKIVERDDLIKNNRTLLDKLQSNETLYDLPHHALMNERPSPDQTDNIFEQDYSFIELINSVHAHSPWKAKAHPQFNLKTHKQMRSLIGMNDAKQLKYLYAQQQNVAQEQESPVFLQQKSTINFKHNFKNILRSNTRNKDTISTHSQNEMHSTTNSRSQDELHSNSQDELHSNSQDELHSNSQSQDAHKKYDKIVPNASTLSDKTLCSESYPSGLPKCFDWRNINNTNYDTPIKKQGDCGSCYSVAMISSIESRIRIQSNNTLQPTLSNNNVIACSRYNQGCNGGYPYLVAKQGYEFGYVTEQCAPYQETDNQCQSQCFDQQTYKLSEYGYVGSGYYGSTNETAMMNEIYHHGPIVVALNAAPDLYYYSSGVFITNPTGLLIQNNKDPRLGQWMFTNHAVVCIGWGETIHQGQIMKYWILKNSWGTEWGEDGYFKMLRGQNLGAVENQAIYARPIISQ